MAQGDENRSAMIIAYGLFSVSGMIIGIFIGLLIGWFVWRWVP